MLKKTELIAFVKRLCREERYDAVEGYWYFTSGARADLSLSRQRVEVRRLYGDPRTWEEVFVRKRGKHVAV